MKRVDALHTPALPDSGALRVFLAVANARGITAAARMLNRSPSSVSMQIKKLEEQLNTTLFVRSPHSLLLTGAGERFLTSVRQLICLNNEAVAALMQPHLHSTVRVGLPGDINQQFLPEVIRQLASAYPRIAVQVVTGTSSTLGRLFDADNLELMLTISDERSRRIGDMIARECFIWVGARDGSACQRTPLPIAIPVEDAPPYHTTALNQLGQHGRRFRVACASASASARQAAARADLAVAPILGSCLTKELIELGPNDGFDALPDLEIRLLESRKTDEAALIVSQSLRDAYSRFVRKDGRKVGGSSP